MLPTSCESGEDALQQLRDAALTNRAFGLILSDVNMPEMSGYDFIEQVRAESEFDRVQIVVLTSGGRPGDEELRAQLRIAQRLMKPAKQSELFDAIVTALGVSCPEVGLTADVEIFDDRLRDLRVLLVEDNVINQKLAVGVLVQHVKTVTIANNGLEAIQALESGEFDVVLMDVQMPVMDGLEATRKIREREAQTGGHIPIVAMTAHAMKGDREKCLDAGMDEYVSKPIHVETLIKRLAMTISIGTSPVTSDPPDVQNVGSVTIDRIPADDVAQTFAPEPRQSVDPIDWDRARRVVGGSEKLLHELLKIFGAEAEKLQKDARQSLASADINRLGRAAHTLKGAALSIGAHDLSSAAFDLEQIAERRDLAIAFSAGAPGSSAPM